MYIYRFFQLENKGLKITLNTHSKNVTSRIGLFIPRTLPLKIFTF